MVPPNNNKLPPSASGKDLPRALPSSNPPENADETEATTNPTTTDEANNLEDTEDVIGSDAVNHETKHLQAIEKEKSYVKFRPIPKAIFKKTTALWFDVHHIDFAHIRSLKQTLPSKEVEAMEGISRCIEILEKATEDDPNEKDYFSICKRLVVCPQCFDDASVPLLKATISTNGVSSSNIGTHLDNYHTDKDGKKEDKSGPLIENTQQPLMSSFAEAMMPRQDAVRLLHQKIFQFVNDNGFPANTVEKKNFRDLLSFTIKNAPRLNSQDCVISNKAITKMRLSSYDYFLKTVAMLARNVRNAYCSLCNNKPTPFATVCHDIWQGNKKDVLGVVIAFIDPRNCVDYKIPIGLCTTKGHTAKQVAAHTMKILHSVGFTQRDLCSSVNDNTNSAVLAGKYILGNNTGGKCDMHRSELILKHATGIAVRKRRGEVIDDNPSFREIYKIFLVFCAWLMSNRARQRFENLRDWAKNNGRVVIEIAMPNQTRVGGCGIMFHGCIRNKHAMDDYYNQCRDSDKEFRKRYPKEEHWKALSQFEAIISPLKTVSMTLQSDSPSSSAAALLEIFNSKHVISKMKTDGVKVLIVNTEGNDNLPRWDARSTIDSLQSKRKKTAYDKLLPSAQLLIKRLLIEYRNYMEEGRDVDGEKAMLGHPFLCSIAPKILQHSKIYDERDVKRIRDQFVSDCVKRMLVVPSATQQPDPNRTSADGSGTAQNGRKESTDNTPTGTSGQNTGDTDANDNASDTASDDDSDDVFNIFESYKAAKDREASQEQQSQNNSAENILDAKQVAMQKLTEKVDSEFGQFLDYSERMISPSWEGHIKKYPTEAFKKESKTWSPKQWKRFKTACTKINFQRVGKYFDVLKWWALYKDRFPHIFPTSIIWIAKPATNAFQERVFSTASMMDGNKTMNRQLDKNFEMRTLGRLTRPLIDDIWKREQIIHEESKKQEESQDNNGIGPNEPIVVDEDSDDGDEWSTDDAIPQEGNQNDVATVEGQENAARFSSGKEKAKAIFNKLSKDSTQGEIGRMEQILRSTHAQQSHDDSGVKGGVGIIDEVYHYRSNDDNEAEDDKSVDSVEILDIVDLTDVDQVQMMNRFTYGLGSDSNAAIVSAAKEQKASLQATYSTGDKSPTAAMSVDSEGRGETTAGSNKTPSGKALKRKGSAGTPASTTTSSIWKPRAKKARKSPGSQSSRQSSKRTQMTIAAATARSKSDKPPPGERVTAGSTNTSTRTPDGDK